MSHPFRYRDNDFGVGNPGSVLCFHGLVHDWIVIGGNLLCATFGNVVVTLLFVYGLLWSGDIAWSAGPNFYQETT